MVWGGDEAVKIPGLRPGVVGVAAVRYEDFGGAAPSAGLRPIIFVAKRYCDTSKRIII